MKLGIVTDSTSDLPPQLIDQYDLQVVPSILVMEGKEYADGSGITRQEFYQQLPGLKTAPTTAAPSIGEFSARYQNLLSQGHDHIVSIHASSALTAIYAAAQQAARDFPGRITVVDSRSLSLGLGFQALAAAEGLQAALEAMESTRARSQLFAVLDTLLYARRSGRIPAAMSVFGGLLQIKPMIEVADGEVKAVGALRTAKQAEDRMAAFFHEGGRFERLAILHTGAEPRAKAFLNRLMRESSAAIPREILIVNVTPVIGAHAGPNGLGFAGVRA